MAHDIWSKRFYSARNKPAWHEISLFDEVDSLDADQDYTARQILTAMGEPQVIEIPLIGTIPNTDITVSSEHKQLVRLPTPDDPVHVSLGVVADSYELITPLMAAEDWDEKVALTVETMAFLKRGGKLFITGKLPAFNVGGMEKERVEHYLIMVNPMDGAGAASGYVSSTRVVCQNTLTAAINRSIQSFKIRHHQGARELLRRWLHRTYKQAEETVSVLNEAFDIMVKTPYSDEQVGEMVTKIYPIPKRPKRDVPRKAKWEDVEKAFEYRKEWVDRARETVTGLWNGQGTGYHDQVAGTQWWAWQSVSEFETYRRGRKDSMGINGINGDRAVNLKRAFSHITA